MMKDEKMKQDDVLLQHAGMIRGLAVTVREMAANVMDIAMRVIVLEQKIARLVERYRTFTVGRADNKLFRLNDGNVTYSVSGFQTAKEAATFLGELKEQREAVARGEFYIDGPMEEPWLVPRQNGAAKTKTVHFDHDPKWEG